MKKILNILLTLMIGALMLSICRTISSLGYKSVSNLVFIVIMLLVLFMQEIQEYFDKRKILNAGVEGETRLKNALNSLKKDKYKLLNGFYLKGDSITQEIDSLVISECGLFNIECKNFGGNISIDKNGVWHRERHGKKDILKNPKEQVERHNKVLREVVGQVDIIDVIVISNERATISGKENMDIPVVKYTEILDFIKNYKGRNKYSINKLESDIKSRITGYSDIKNYKEKNKKPWYKSWDFAIRLIVVAYLLIYYFFL